MTIDTEAYPKLAELWDRLRRGAHIHSGDGADYFELRDRYPEYQAVFALFGHQLIEHPGKFYFLEGKMNDGARPAGIANILALSFVLIDIANNSGAGFDQWFFPPSGSARRLSEIKPFNLQQHREVLVSANIKDETRIELTLKNMTRLGFIEFDGDAITFLPPFLRIRDLCIQIGSMDTTQLDSLAEADVSTSGDTNESDNGE